MNNKMMAGWAVMLAVVVIFLLSITVLGKLLVFGVSGSVAVIAGIGILFVGVLAAIIGIYWGRR